MNSTFSLALAAISLSATVAMAEDFYDVSSPEEAAKVLLDRECGGDGQLVSSNKADEDYDFAAYLVEQTNGEATVYSFKNDASTDPNRPNYYSIDEFSCY